MIQMNLSMKQKQRRDKGDEGGMNWESGVSRCKLLYIVWTNNKVLL